jgi:ankyrin repeat protein
VLPSTANHQAKCMSKIHAVRLLHGRLDALQKFGPDLPWLHKLEAAAQLLRTASRPSPFAISPIMPSKEDAAYRETVQQICASVVDYLGVPQVIDSLDANRQDLCCQEHYFPDWEAKCSVPCFEPSKRFRRPESTLDWAILTAMYTRDFAVVPDLLKSHLGPNPELPASLQYSAGRNYETTFRLLLDAGVDINGLGHATANQYCDDLDWNNGSALEAACAAGHLGIVKVCLSPDYNLNLSGHIYEDAMIIAARLDDHKIALKTVKLLLSRLTSWHHLSGTTQAIFENTCRNGNVDVGKLVFENAPYNLNTLYPDGKSPLSVAIEHDHADMVIYTLSQHRSCLNRFPHHQNVWSRYFELNKSMRHAARSGRAHVASLIWTELDSWPMGTLLSDAARHGKVSMIEFLMSKGLDLSKTCSANRDPETIGEHALILAAEHAHESTTKFLLGLGIRTFNLRPFSSTWAAEPQHAERSEEGVQNLLLAYGLGLVPNKRK